MNDDVYFVMSDNREGDKGVRLVIAASKCDALVAHQENYPEEKILSIRQ